MPSRKSDGPGGHEDDEKLESPSPEARPDDPSGLPPAGAESAAEPDDGLPAGGPVPESDAPAEDTAPAAGMPPYTFETDDEGFFDMKPAATRTAAEAEIGVEAGTMTDAETGVEAGTVTDAEIGVQAGTAADAETGVPAVESVPVEAVTDPAPIETPPAAARHDPHEDEDEGGASFAAWALGILLLLLAGAALGTYLAPKIAPELPAGMKPVADWLEPGKADAEAAIAALRGQLEAVEAKAGAAASTADVDARIGAAVSPVESRLADEIGSLRQSVAQIDPTEARQRLDSLAAELKNQAAQLDTLKSGFTEAPGQVSGDVNVFKADMEGLRAEVASLRDQVSAQATRLDEVAKSAEERVAAAVEQATTAQEQATTALDAAEASSQEALIRAAVASGAPYADAVTTLEAHGIEVPAELAAAAASGIPTLASLRESFADAAHGAIQSSVLASAGDGVLARANAFVKAQVASRSLTPQPGTGTDAVLSRMEDKLRQDDLAGALAESQALPSEAAAAMQGWLDSAKLRLGATQGLAALAQSLPATN